MQIKNATDRADAIARITEFVEARGPLAFIEAGPPSDPAKLPAYHEIRLIWIASVMTGLDLPASVVNAIRAAADFLGSISKEGGQ